MMKFSTIKSTFALCAAFFVITSVHAQIYEMSNTTIVTCTGQFKDDGVAGAPYSDTDYTMTICPDNPGDVISVDFTVFSVQQSANPNNSDYLYIYDGDNTGAQSLGSYTGNSLAGLAASGTVNNLTGCLTFRFVCNTGNTQGFPGWTAIISCTTPCDSPTSGSEILDPVPSGIEQSIGVCLNEPVTFGDNGSFAAAGFNIAQYIWKFDDGSVDTLSGPIVVHSFSEPGEYVVTLTVEDNNGCQSLNIEPLQVLVSTIPEFNSDFDSEICLGTTAQLDGTPMESTTWTALPPQVVGSQFYLSDDLGFTFSNSIVFDYFDPDAVLEDCDDFLSLTLNMEHSYMGDLNISMSCPDGTEVTLVEFPNGGGGTFLGEPIDDDGDDTPGVGYDYGWSPTATNGTWGENSGGFGESLDPGFYESDFSLCDFVGCPLNGAWTLNITDNLGSDDGYIFEFGVNFNPALFPDITTFTPIYGDESDSTYWEGPYIIDSTADGNIITVLPEIEGAFDYTFYASNNFGCTFDTTVTVNVTAMPEIEIIPDFSLCPGEVGNLNLGLAGTNFPECSAVSGLYDYCYTNNENTVISYCPDNQGDGITFISIEFLTGQMENFFDDVTIFDGANTAAPILGVLSGDLTGQTFQATNATGCITLQFSSDGSVSCGSGSFPPMQYELACAQGLGAYEFSWSPADGLSDPSVYNPTVTIDQGSATYTVEAYPPGFPECATSDDVTVSINADVDPGTDVVEILCFNFGQFDLFDYLGGTPAVGGVWTDSGGNVVTGDFDTATDAGDIFTYTLDNNGCTASATVDITVLPAGDPACCEFDYSTVVTDVSCFGADNGQIDIDIVSTSEGGPWDFEVFDDMGGLVATVNTANGTANVSNLPIGDYSFVLTDIGLCTTTEDFTIVDALPQTFEVGADTTICIGGTATLTAFSDQNVNGDWVFTWDNGLPANGTVNASPDVATTYSVFATTTEGCVLDPLTVDVDFHDPLVVETLNDTLLCQNTSASLGLVDSTGGFGDYQFEWTFLGAVIGSTESLEYNVLIPGQYCVEMTDACETPAVSNCMQVDIETPIDVQFNADILSGCSPLDVVFTHNLDTSNIDEILWDNGDGIGGVTDTLIVSYEDPGVFDVSLMVTSDTGCEYETMYPNYINVFNNPLADFYAEPQPTTIPDTEINFYDYSEGSVVSYFWVFDTLNYLGTSFDQNPIFEFPELEPGTYPVLLTVTDLNGCTDERLRNVVINDLFNLYIPTGFTPNGDGVNDVFFAQGTDIDPDRFHMWVYDRWGGLVFETQDINKKWTGNVSDGEYFIQDGVYNWRVEVHSLATSQRKEFKGTVTILR